MSLPQFAVLAHPEQDKEAWLEARRTHLTASDIPAMLGLDPGKSPLQLYAEKLGLMPEKADSDTLRWGLDQEESVARFVGRKLNMVVHPSPGLVQNPVCPLIAATPDRILEDEEGNLYVLEIKTGKIRAVADWEDGPPLRHKVQNQVQIATLGLVHGMLAGALGGNPPVMFRNERDEHFEEVCYTEADRFWDRVTNKRPPEADGSASAARAIEAMYPNADGSTVNLPLEARLWTDAIEALDAEIKELDANRDKYKAMLKSEIGEATFGYLPPLVGGEPAVMWKFGTENRKEFTVAANSFRRLRRVKA